MQASDDRGLAKPGRTVLIVLTPGGSLRDEWSTPHTSRDEAHFQLIAAGDELVKLLSQRLEGEPSEPSGGF